MVHQAGKIYDSDERQRFLDWLWDYEFNIFGLPVPDHVFFLNIPPDVNQILMQGRANKITGEAKQDIHEKSLTHLQDSYNSGMELVEQYGWTEISCISDNKLRSIQDINNEIFNKI